MCFVCFAVRGEGKGAEREEVPPDEESDAQVVLALNDVFMD